MKSEISVESKKIGMVIGPKGVTLHGIQGKKLTQRIIRSPPDSICSINPRGMHLFLFIVESFSVFNAHVLYDVMTRNLFYMISIEKSYSVISFSGKGI